MTITGNCYIDLGSNNKGGMTYVALSRTKFFKNIIIEDIKESIFKKYIPNGINIKKHLDMVNIKEINTIRKYNFE